MMIVHNIPALDTFNALNSINRALSKAILRLSTGLRINSASDDVAGVTISERMRAQTAGLSRAIENSEDGIGLLQTAEGALESTQSILQRMRELSVQAANDSLTSQDRSYIQLEIDQLENEINNIANTTSFNGKRLLDGSSSGLWSSDRLSTLAYLNGSLNEVDQFGQKNSFEGNYKIEVEAIPGQAQVQKTNIFQIDEQINEGTVTTTVVNKKTVTTHVETEYIKSVTYDDSVVYRHGITSYDIDNGGSNPFILEGKTVTVAIRDDAGTVIAKQEVTFSRGICAPYIQDKLKGLAEALNDELNANGLEDFGKVKSGGIVYSIYAVRPDLNSIEPTYGIVHSFSLDFYSTKVSNPNAIEVSVTKDGEPYPDPSDTNFLKDGFYTGMKESLQSFVIKTPLNTDTIDVAKSVTVSQSFSAWELRNLKDIEVILEYRSPDNPFTPTSVTSVKINLSSQVINSVDDLANVINNEVKSLGMSAEVYYDRVLLSAICQDLDGDTNPIGEMFVRVEGTDGRRFMATHWNTSFSRGENGCDDLKIAPPVVSGPTPVSSPPGYPADPKDDVKESIIDTTVTTRLGYTDNPGTTIVPLSTDTKITNVSTRRETKTEIDSNGRLVIATYDITTRTFVTTDYVSEITETNEYALSATIPNVTGLNSLSQFYNSEGRFILDTPKTITITQGNGLSTSVTLYGTEMLLEVVEKLNNAIADGLGQAKYLAEGEPKNKFVTVVTGANITNGLESVIGTLLIRSVVAGKAGELHFSGDEDVLRALGLSTIQESSENSFNVTITNAHDSLEVIAKDVQISGNKLMGILHKNVDIEIDNMADIEVTWNDKTREFELKASDRVYSTILHLAENSLVLQIGANEGEDMVLSIGDMSAAALGIDRVLVIDRESASRAISILDQAITKVSSQRAKIGTYQNTLEYTITNLTTTYTNLSEAENRIRDADMAQEMMEFVKMQILNQSGTLMLSQANQLPQSVLSLLES